MRPMWFGVIIALLAGCSVSPAEPPVTTAPPSGPTATPTSGPTATPTSGPTATPTLSLLEQARLSWRSANDYNEADRFRGDTGAALPWGLVPNVTITDFAYFTGVILGAVVGPSGYVLAVVGMQDGRGNRFDVTFLLGTNLIIEPANIHGFPVCIGYASRSRISSTDFLDRVGDGRYLDQPVYLMVVLDTQRSRDPLAPRHSPAVEELLRFLQAIQHADYASVANPVFVNAGLSDPASVDPDPLPYFADAAVRDGDWQPESQAYPPEGGIHCGPQ